MIRDCVVQCCLVLITSNRNCPWFVSQIQYVEIHKERYYYAYPVAQAGLLGGEAKSQRKNECFEIYITEEL